jgi:hypothetical protein
MICQLCKTRTDLIEAHIIPAGFFRRLDAKDGPPRLLAHNEREYPKRTPVGVYDAGILCGGCEPLFGPWDQYAQEVLADSPLGVPQIEQGKVVGYELAPGQWQYTPLKLFLVSLAWRASVSTHRFFTKVRLGPFEERARSILLAGNVDGSEDFAGFIAMFADPLGKTILSPHHERIEGVNFVRFYLAGYVAYIKADRRSSPGWTSTFLLSREGPLKIICRGEFASNKEFALARSIATMPQNALRTRQGRSGHGVNGRVEG